MRRSVIHLKKSFFDNSVTEIAQYEGCSADLFRFDTGIEGIRLANQRGELVLLPYYGQMIWRATFDGVDLTMSNPFNSPRPAQDIVGTYGCFMYHSGLLSNGNPGLADKHALHGEMPIAQIDQAGLEMGEDPQGPFMAVFGEREYVMGFGDHYVSRTKVLLRPGQATFEISMEVENLGLDTMDLMYMCHANFAYVEGGRIVQPTGFGSADTVIRSSVPAIVRSNDAYLKRLQDVGADPSVTEVMDAATGLDPELVFYLQNLRKADDGLVHVMMRRPTGDAFMVAYDPTEFSHLVRWILVNNKHKVCAFAMPATCGVEGYSAEKAKGTVRSLKFAEKANFHVRLGYLDAADAQREEALILASV